MSLNHIIFIFSLYLFSLTLVRHPNSPMMTTFKSATWCAFAAIFGAVAVISCWIRKCRYFNICIQWCFEWLAWDCLLFFRWSKKIYSVHGEPIQINWFCASQAHISPGERRTEMSTKRSNQFIAYSSSLFFAFFLSSFCFALRIAICNNTTTRWNWMNDTALNWRKKKKCFNICWYWNRGI